MHTLEPFYNWRQYYEPDEDAASPFYESGHSPTGQGKLIYNYVLNPEWEDFGSATLYLKILFADYDRGFAVLEMMGEWNDCLHNDVMYFKRDVIEPLEAEGIRHFILIGENVLNFHASDDCYYQEWFDETVENGGWIAAINFRDHVRDEMETVDIPQYFLMNAQVINWRTFTPWQFFELVDQAVTRRLSSADWNQEVDSE
ncbi:MAG: hypothetical protein GC205_01760 [Bacteroidetes bacterium]|nr:hypothetical protein [Bacteroidota bacterium]